MTNRRLIFRRLIVGCLGTSMLLVCSITAWSQAPAKPEAPPDPFRDMKMRRDREVQLRSLSLPTGKSAAEAQPLDLAQVAKDYKQLQVTRNELVRAITANQEMSDPKLLASRISEINLRAKRLRPFVLPNQSVAGAEVKPKKTLGTTDPAHIKDELIQLCNRVASLVDNPIFKLAGKFDLAESAKAGRDVEAIIELSDRLKSSTGQISKH